MLLLRMRADRQSDLCFWRKGLLRVAPPATRIDNAAVNKK